MKSASTFLAGALGLLLLLPSVRAQTCWELQADISGNHITTNSAFGLSTGIDGDVVVVGAPDHDHAVQGDGAAYAFVRNGTIWNEVAELTTNGNSQGARLGISVGVSVPNIVVGADYNGTGAGRAFVFEPVTGTYDELLVPTGQGGTLNSYGAAVSISEDRAVVGSFSDDGSHSGGNDGGSAFVFVDSGAGWAYEWRLLPATRLEQSWFGYSVAIASDTIVVGAPKREVGAENDAGAAFVFVHTAGTPAWIQQAELTAPVPTAGDEFGQSVAISGDRIVVGAHLEMHGSGSSTGAVYIYGRSGSTWSLESRITSCQQSKRFGDDVAIQLERLVVGDHHKVHILDRDATTNVWEVTRIISGHTGSTDSFGRDLAVSGGTVLIGDAAEDGTGKAYVYAHGGACIVPYCFGDGTGTVCPCMNPGGPGHGCANGTFPQGCILGGSGNAGVGTDTFVLAVANSTPGQPGLFFQGDNSIANGAGATFGDGLRCAGGNVVRLQVRVADGGGGAATTVGISNAAGLCPGELKRYQWWYRDPALSPCGFLFNLSNGLEVTWAP